MILSVSRKTDIPAYYTPWFFNRVREGFCYTQNPMNAKQVSKVLINRDVVDGIVFWTKNPKPMLSRLHEIKDYPFYFQFTISSYGQDIETHLPRKKELVETFQRLSDSIGPYGLVWRYDPILLNPKYTVDYHIENFAILAKNLSQYTHRVVISFIDYYTKIATNWRTLGLQHISLEQKKYLAKNLAEIAMNYSLHVESCSEDINLEQYGIAHSRCIDDRLFAKILGMPFELQKDKAQRAACGCVESVDIGMYNSCNNGCKYCYASFSQESILKNMQRHNPDYPLLLGTVPEGITIKDKKQKLFVQRQKSLFDL